MMILSTSSGVNILTLLFILLSSCIECRLNDIVMTDDEPTIGPPVSTEKAFHFMTTGITDIFWTHSAANFTRDSAVSTQCRNSLAAVSSGLASGDILPFHFVDASAKTPPGLIRSSMVGLGDYDQCLAIDGTIEGVPIKGKYCAADMFPVRVSATNDRKSGDTMTTGKMTFDRVSVIKRIPFIQSLCVPSQCSDADVRHMLSVALEPYALKVTGHMNCDTVETTSALHKLKSFNLHQIISLLFISTVILSVLTCTFIHLYARAFAILTDTPESVSTTVNSLSLITASSRLFWSREKSWQFFFIDCLKVCLLIPSVMGHVIASLDVPLGLGLVNNHDNFSWLLSTPVSQLIIWESGLAMIPALTGVLTALIAYPMIKSGRMNYVGAIVDRIIRATPGLAVMTALEFIWPLSGDGPLWSRVANFVTNRCTRNWWRTFLFMNNFEIETGDACPASSVYSSIDMQFLPIGLMVLFFFSRSHKLGSTVCVILAYFCSRYVAHNMITYDVPALYLEKNLDAARSMKFSQYVHLATAGYVPGYLIGIYSGYLLSEHNYRLPARNLLDVFKWYIFGALVYDAALFLTAAHSMYSLFPKSIEFLVPLLNRPLNAASCMILLFVLLTMVDIWNRDKKKPPQDEKKEPTSEKVEEKSTEPEKVVSFSMFRAMCRLLLPVYLTNYWVVRYLYFSSRSVYSSDIVPTLSRIVSSMVVVFLHSYLVQIFLLSPMDYLRSRFMSSLLKSKKD